MKGKCKKDFEEWCPSYVMKVDDDPVGLTHINPYYKDYFNELPHSMQWGVIADFFDSVGVNISILPYWEGRYTRGFEPSIYQDGIVPITIYQNNDVFTTRHEARAAAIEKATEIYNERS